MLMTLMDCFCNHLRTRAVLLLLLTMQGGIEYKSTQISAELHQLTGSVRFLFQFHCSNSEFVLVDEKIQIT